MANCHLHVTCLDAKTILWPPPPEIQRGPIELQYFRARPEVHAWISFLEHGKHNFDTQAYEVECKRNKLRSSVWTL